MALIRSVDSGIAKGHVSTAALSYVIVVFTCLAIYNVLELTFIIWAAFKRHSGMYFTSFVVATYGILIYSIGFLLKAEAPTDVPYLYVTLIAIGWVAMVTGQSLVLWSRLHLILRDRRKLNLILYMIIFNAIILHVPIIVMLYGSNSNHPDRWIHPYSIYEKVQVTIFFIQESLISSIYIFETVKLSRILAPMRTKKRSRDIMHHLIIINVIIIILDITIISLEYANLYNVQTAYKALVYSVKLKMEFSILNRMVEMTTGIRESTTTTDSRPGSRAGHSDHHSSAALQRGSSAASNPSNTLMRQSSVLYRASIHGGMSEANFPHLADRRARGDVIDHDVLMTMDSGPRDHDAVKDQLPTSELMAEDVENTDDVGSSSSSGMNQQ